MKKRKTVWAQREGVVVPFRRKLRSLAKRTVNESILYATLAAGKARRALDDLDDLDDLSYFNEHRPAPKPRDLVDFLVAHFQQKGVRFDRDGRPLLPLGLCGDVDAEKLSEATSMIAIEFFDALADKFGADFCLDGEFESLYDLGWRHGFLHSHDPDDPERWLVPIVLTLDMKSMQFILESRGTGRTSPRGAETPVEELVAAQKPEVWERWLRLKGRAV